MTPQEAATAIGYTQLASVLFDLRVGKLKRTRDGGISNASVANRKANRDRQLVRWAKVEAARAAAEALANA